MKNHPFKNFIPYAVALSVQGKIKEAFLDLYAGDDSELVDRLNELSVKEPGDHDWGSKGFTNPLSTESDLLASPTSGIYHLAIRFNEKILPGKVRDEHVAKRVAEIEQRDGRKIFKKEYAQVRDEVEFELLPKAFIRRSVVHVLYVPQRLFIFTSSAKRADDVFVLLKDAGLVDGAYLISGGATKFPLGDLLERVAGEAQDELSAGDAATFKHDKQTIRVKDRDIYGSEVQDILNEGYEPTELRIDLLNDDRDDVLLSFTLNDKFVFKRVQIADVALESHFESQDDNASAFQTFTIIMAGYCKTAVQSIVDKLGGLKGDAADDEDDEL